MPCRCSGIFGYPRQPTLACCQAAEERGAESPGMPCQAKAAAFRAASFPSGTAAACCKALCRHAADEALALQDLRRGEEKRSTRPRVLGCSHYHGSRRLLKKVCCPVQPFPQGLLLAYLRGTSHFTFHLVATSVGLYSVCIVLGFDSLSCDRRLYADQGARVKKKRPCPAS